MSLISAAILPYSALAAADIEITEIMFNPQGGDSGREWIEIYNGSGSAINLSDFRFFESKVNHKLNFSGTASLAAGEYAVIADKPDLFLADHTDFVGMVIDSAFSLNNTGEVLVIRDGSGNDVDVVSYVADNSSPAADTGASLQKQPDGSWLAAMPTPGYRNSTKAFEIVLEKPENPEDINPEPVYSSVPTIESYGQDDNLFLNEYRLYIFAGENLRELPEREINFVALAKDPARRDVINGNFKWNFGDGSRTKGRRVSHIFENTGLYIITVDGSHRDLEGEDKVLVEIIEPRFELSLNEFGVKVYNDTDFEIDLKELRLVSGEREYIFTENSIVAPRTGVMFGDSVTGSIFSEVESVKLLSPKGSVWAKAERTQEEIEVLLEPSLDTPVSSEESLILLQEKLETAKQLLREMQLPVNAGSVKKESAVTTQMTDTAVVQVESGAVASSMSSQSTVDAVATEDNSTEDEVLVEKLVDQSEVVVVGLAVSETEAKLNLVQIAAATVSAVTAALAGLWYLGA